MTKHSRTSTDAYKKVLESGTDATLRRQVAAALAIRPRTTHELVRDAFPDRHHNSISPRVNELVRMGCVRRGETRPTPAGNDAYVNELTPLGEQYARGEADPDMEPNLTGLKARVVDIARKVVHGDADPDALEIALERHDDLYRRLNPDSEPGEN